MEIYPNKNVAVDGVHQLISYAKDFRLGFTGLRVRDNNNMNELFLINES
jgi:hypothetical protein